MRDRTKYNEYMREYMSKRKQAIRDQERIRREAGVPTGAVGLITTPDLCEEIVANGRADVVLVAGTEACTHPITIAAFAATNLRSSPAMVKCVSSLPSRAS